MARSVAELLPRPFQEITLDDVAEIIRTIGEERETLFFERKASVSGNSLAKACAAFANTYGGLLVVGVADENDALVGTDPIAGEAQMWVKDTLRSLVLPLPPFRARQLPTEGGRVILLTLIDESTATPHLLTRSGAIYVRNPGSSDPVPLTDQRRLLELVARGERAEQAASQLAEGLDRHTVPEGTRAIETLAVAATGVSYAFEELLFDAAAPDRIADTLWGPVTSPHNDRRKTSWEPDRVGVTRWLRGSFASEAVETAAVDRRGGIVCTRSWDDGSRREDRDVLDAPNLREQLADWFESCRSLLDDLGAHGRLRFRYVLDPDGRGVMFMTRHANLETRTVDLWVRFDEEGADVATRVFAEIARAGGYGPGQI